MDATDYAIALDGLMLCLRWLAVIGVAVGIAAKSEGGKDGQEGG